MSYGDVPDGLDFSGSDEEEAAAASYAASNSSHHHHHHHHGGGGGHHHHHHHAGTHHRPRSSQASVNSAGGDQSGQQQHVTCYRLGSVGEDTLLCLWDLTEDLLKKATQVFCSALCPIAGTETFSLLATGFLHGLLHRSRI